MNQTNNMSNGWICLHRSLVDWEWYSDVYVKAVFLHLLLMANSQPQRYCGMEIKRGQRLTSIRHLADELQINHNSVSRALKALVDCGSITIEADKKRGSLVTIVNYDRYQSMLDNTSSEVVNGGQLGVPLSVPSDGTLHGTQDGTLSGTKQQYNNITLVDVVDAHAHTHAREGEPIDASNLEWGLAELKRRNLMETVYMRSKLDPQQVEELLPEFYVTQRDLDEQWSSLRRLLDHLANWMAKKADIIRRQEKQDKHYGNNKQQADALIAQSKANWRAMASIQGTDDSIR